MTPSKELFNYLSNFKDAEGNTPDEAVVAYKVELISRNYHEAQVKPKVAPKVSNTITAGSTVIIKSSSRVGKAMPCNIPNSFRVITDGISAGIIPVNELELVHNDQ